MSIVDCIFKGGIKGALGAALVCAFVPGIGLSYLAFRTAREVSREIADSHNRTSSSSPPPEGFTDLGIA